MKQSQRRVTNADVAREAGVSTATVSYVLNKHPHQTIPEETQRRVLEAVRTLGYQPFAPARWLASGQSKIVLVVWHEEAVETPVASLIEQLAAAVAKIGFTLLCQIGLPQGQEHLSVNLAPAVVVGLVDPTDAEAVAGLERFHAPSILVAGPDWGTLGTRAQMTYLLEQGAQTIVYAATAKPSLSRLCQAREQVAREMCRDHALPDPYVVTIPQNREQAREVVAELLAVQSPPFAICAYNDDVALAALAALDDLNIAVPSAVRVIGQDNGMMADLSHPPLTSVGVESSQLVERLIASVVSACQGGPVLEIGPVHAQVVVRVSA